MTVISDTTPIISLIKINRLDLLEKLFGEVLIPEAVYRELTTNALFETIGVLLQAYSETMISSDEIKAYLDRLKNSNIRLSESLIQKALEIL